MDKNYLDVNWAEMVDILAKEYGWTISYIGTLDLGQITTLLKAIKARYNKQNDTEDSQSENSELAISDFKAMGKEGIREDGRKEIVI